MVRLVFLTVLAASILAKASFATDSAPANVASPASNLTLPVELDDFGKPLTIIDSGGDYDWENDNDDDDDEDDEIADDEIAAMRRRKHHHKHSARKGKKHHFTRYKDENAKFLGTTQITWYADHDLQNPQCGDGKWNPNNGNHIGAVMAGWPGGPRCGEFVQICNPKAKHGRRRCIKARIVDKCAGCGHNHVDLTKSAFKRLSPSGSLTEGRIHHLPFYSITKPNPFDKGLWGPLRLK